MLQKKNLPGLPSATLPTMRIGSRVRCTDDQVEGRIVWANGVSVKIQWDDGEQVTWKRAELDNKGLEFLDTGADETTVQVDGSVAPEPTPATEKAPAPPSDSETKKMSALDAAAKVLAESRQPMNCKELIGAMAVKEYWSSPSGKTPAATLYSAILRELTKGSESRFVKLGRGYFAFKS